MTATASRASGQTATGEAEVRRATRNTDDTYLAGVASGLARHLGLPVLWVRLGFIVAAVLGGIGIAFYAGLWMVLPTDDTFSDEAPGLAGATRAGKRPGPVRRIGDLGPTIALGSLALGIVLMFESAFGRGALFWPVVIGVGGVALIWRQADEVQRERWLDTTQRLDPFRALVGSGGWASWARLIVGGLMILGALAVFAWTSGSGSIAGEVVVAGLLGVAGLALTAGPWVIRLASDLGDERAERVRSQERADMAAHLHDSVLQTLALIQKNAADPVAVARLARSQERDLRSWLFAEQSTEGESLAAALRRVAVEVEDGHHVTVEVVTVGDAPLDEGLAPVVQAAREALTNAAKHAGTERVDVYAEVSPARVEVFVKDRGRGFDLADVADDRHGVRGSIIDRMARHGGTAEVRTTPGEGTEVVLGMPRSQKEEER
ncbi:ATP-binding protein [Nocardioides daejeonensis]|uniref:ATP-binding protein n=1 Tax=Nocardioides daejeonensis TaxID=1046556 RepID=UPI000D74D7F7|nr:ATP-binding protein [Nocardioides daejeonensis]